jgi:hypothetical protein
MAGDDRATLELSVYYPSLHDELYFREKLG